MFIGVDGIIVNKMNACGLTPAVSKVSSGALEMTPLFQVKFVRPFLEDATTKHGFKIISTNLDENEDKVEETTTEKGTAAVKKPIIPLSSLEFSKDENLMVVMGSEGEGVSKMISELAFAKVMIPPMLNPKMIGKPPFNMIDSLNVGVSAAMMLYHIQSMRKF